MKKIMNFRPIVAVALSIIFSIILATFVFSTIQLRLSLFVFSLFLSVSLLICVCIFKTKLLKLIFVCLLLSCISIGQVYFKNYNINQNSKYNDKDLLVSGRICSNYKFTSSGNLTFFIDNIVVGGENFSDEIDGKMSIFISSDNYDLNDFEIGTTIQTFGKIKTNSINDDSKYSLTNLSKNIIGSCYVSYHKITFISKNDMHFDEKVRSFVYEKLQSFDIDYADVGYTMMFGDSVVIDNEVQTTFRTTGIAHILAVSGLHVGILAFLISALLKLFRLPKFANFFIMLILLIFYCYLCDYSVSMVRASIMTLLMIYLSARGKCYDRLIALAFSLCLILPLNPLNLFNTSLILSYMSVISIILLTYSFKNIFEKIFYKKLSSSLALLFSVQLGLLFVQLFYFNDYSLISVICNFISVPVVTISFVLLLIGTLISLIFPFMSFICLIYDFLMSLVVKFNFTMSKLGLIISIDYLNFLFVLAGLFIIVLLSDYIFIKKKYRVCGLIALTLFCGLLIFV